MQAPPLFFAKRSANQLLPEPEFPMIIVLEISK